jgi:hypothetical protein
LIGIKDADAGCPHPEPEATSQSERTRAMKDPELDLLISTLETRADLSVADFDAVIGAMHFLLPERPLSYVTSPAKLATTDGAMIVADEVYPNWVVHIRGRANDRDGHWHCMLRENDARDSDAAIGSGRSPVLAQAVLAAVLRLSMHLSRVEPSS